MTAHMACIASSFWVPEIADTDVHNMFAMRFRDHRILAGRQNSHTILLRRYARRATGAIEANQNQRSGGSIPCSTGRCTGHIAATGSNGIPKARNHMCCAGNGSSELECSCSECNPWDKLMSNNLALRHLNNGMFLLAPSCLTEQCPFQDL